MRCPGSSAATRCSTICIAAQGAKAAVTLPHAGAVAIFTDPQTIIAGSVQVKGEAWAVSGGYRVSGRWPFASGCRHATWVLAHGPVLDANGPRLRPDGRPETRCLLIPAAVVEILDTWYTTGLRGTGSHDFTLTDVFVPETHAFELSGPLPETAGPLYRLPVLTWTIQGSHALGVANHALAAFADLAGAKVPLGTTSLLRERTPVQEQVGHAVALVEAARRYLYGVVSEVWAQFTAGEHPSVEQRAQVRLASAYAVRSALQAVELLYRAADSSAIYASNPLERCFRDLNTAASHIAIGWRVYEGVGRVTLGLEAPTVVFT
jgi:alkylation response protein AidB-like acyl-CoA dehydrogenase